MARAYVSARLGRERMIRSNGQIPLDHASDSELIQIIAARKDREAFATLFKRYEKLGYRVALHVAYDHHLAEEAFLEAMHNIWRSAHTFRPDGNARAWITRIIARSSMKSMQVKGRRLKHEQDGLDNIKEPPKPTNEYVNDTEELLAGLRLSMRTLPAIDRNIVALRFIGGLSQAEIGKELSMSQRTVSERLGKVLVRLKNNLMRSGLTAALPLLTDDGLARALSEGSAPRPSFMESALDKILALDSEKDKILSPSLDRSNNPYVLLVSIALIFAASAWAVVAWQKDHSTTALSTEKQSMKEGAINASAASRMRHWDFNEPDLNGLSLIEGDWKHLPDGGPDGSGCMATSTHLRLRLDQALPLSSYPLEVRFKMSTGKSAFPGHLGQWEGRNPEALIVASPYGGEVKNNVAGVDWIDVQCIFTKRGTCLWINKQMRALSMVNHQEDDRLVLQVFKGSRIDDLNVRKADTSKVSEVARYIHAIDRIPPNKRNEWHELPELMTQKKNDQPAVIYRVHFPTVKPTKHAKTQTWNFTHPDDLLDFGVIKGEWKFLPKGGQRKTGSVQILNASGFTIFDYQARKPPFLVTARFLVMEGNPKHRMPSLVYINRYGDPRSKRLSSNPDLKDGQWVTFRFYVTRQYIDIWTKKQRIELRVQFVEPQGIVAFHSDYETQLDFLEVKDLKPEQLPKLGTYRAIVDETHAQWRTTKAMSKEILPVEIDMR